MLTLLWEAIIGMIVGTVAKLLRPGKDPRGNLRHYDFGHRRIHCRDLSG